MKTILLFTGLIALSFLSCHSADRGNPLDPVDFVPSRQLQAVFESRTASASLSWDPASEKGFESYVVLRRDGPDGAEVPIDTIRTAGDAAFLDTGLEGNTEYAYRVMTRDTMEDEYLTDRASGGFHMFLDKWRVGAGPSAVPYAADVDHEGNVYVVVANSGDLGVEKFDASGKPLLAWPVCSNWGFPGTMGIACDSEGNVYVNSNIVEDVGITRSGVPMLTKFDGEGELQWSIEMASDPEFGTFSLGVAVDDDDRILVFDTWRTGNNMHRFSTEGEYLDGYRFEEVQGFIIQVSGLEVWHEFMGIADWGEDRVRIARADGSASGAFPEGVGSRGIMNGQLSDPVDFAVDDAGRFFVVDAANGRVQVFEDASYLTKWGTQGDGPGEFDFVSRGGGDPKGGIALGGGGKIYVVDPFNGRIQKFGP